MIRQRVLTCLLDISVLLIRIYLIQLSDSFDSFVLLGSDMPKFIQHYFPEELLLPSSLFKKKKNWLIPPSPLHSSKD
jgi:hypothetical protein